MVSTGASEFLRISLTLFSIISQLAGIALLVLAFDSVLFWLDSTAVCALFDEGAFFWGTATLVLGSAAIGAGDEFSVIAASFFLGFDLNFSRFAVEVAEIYSPELFAIFLVILVETLLFAMIKNVCAVSERNKIRLLDYQELFY